MQRISANKEQAIVKALVRHNTQPKQRIEAEAITQAVKAATQGNTMAEAVEYGIKVLDCLLWLDDIGNAGREPAIWE
jgi:hypothetical protein